MTPVSRKVKLQEKVNRQEAEKTKVKNEAVISIPKIQKVQPYLRNRPDFAKYYTPKLVSIGPIHPPDKDCHENLKGGENYKSMWAASYLEGTNQTAQELVEKIHNNLPALKGLYTEEATEGFREDDEELVWIFLVDGCAVLHFMEKASVGRPEALKIKVDQLVLVQRDLLLLENQLPYQLLKLLCKDGEGKLISYIHNFFKMHHMIREKYNPGTALSLEQVEITVDPPAHLLDLLRRVILGPHGDRKNRVRRSEWNPSFPSYRNIQELKASGIQVRKAKRNARLIDITFGHPFHFAGRLYLSKLVVDEFTAPTFLNMIAYEMCPDFQNHYEISSYIAFLDSLIDHPDDVKELRKAGVLHNVLGSDEEVSKLFNTISADLVPDTETYVTLRDRIQSHYKKKYMTWMAQFYYDHFCSPWATLGFLAAFIALVLTFLQTVYTILQSKSK